MTSKPAKPVTRTARTALDGFPSADAAAPIHGWIVSWELDGIKIPFSVLRDALADSGLDPAFARAILPGNAFRRAARELSENRIIRMLDQDESGLRFQFTAETSSADRIEYHLETVMSLDATTGEISSDRDDLNVRAKDAFDRAVATRTTSDVTAVIQRLFNDKKKASLDLIPINKRGVYFVRKEEAAFCDKIEAFVGRLGGLFTRLPIAAGSPAGDRTIKAATANKMADLIGELEDATAAFGAETTERAMKGQAERVKLIRFKLESYKTYLDDEKEKLEASLKGATASLRAKIIEIGRQREAANA